MSAVKHTKTRVSTKGQVILPKTVRERRRWGTGTELVVEDTEDGVLLRKAPLFAATDVASVFGMLGWTGPAKSLDDMDAAVIAEAQRRARD